MSKHSNTFEAGPKYAKINLVRKGSKWLKKWRSTVKTRDLSISYQALAMDFESKSQPTQKISTNTNISSMTCLCKTEKKNVIPQANSTLPTTSTSHLHLGPRRRAWAHDIYLITSSLPSLRNRDMPLTEPWRWVNPPRFGRVCMWKGWDKVTFLLLDMGVWGVELGVVPLSPSQSLSAQAVLRLLRSAEFITRR